MGELLQRLFGKDDYVAGYATAVVAVAEAEGALGRVEDELYAFAKAAEQEPRLREALTDQTLPLENRTALVRDVLGDRAHPLTITLVSFLVESGRARDLGKIVEAPWRSRPSAGSTSWPRFVPRWRSTDAQRERLERALSRATGRQVEAKVVVDPTVVGGVIARVDDLVFDGSVASRLEDAKHALGS